MGLIELANLLSMDKGLASRLVKKGMPTSSAAAANAWRAVHAPPRTKRQAAPSPVTAVSRSAPARSRSPSSPASGSQATEADSTDLPGDPADSPSESLRRARATEGDSFKKLEALQRDRMASPEDLRKSSSVYFSSRANRQKAESDFREWQRAEGITLFLSEAQDITNRGHLAVANQLREGPKALSPRLHAMSQKSIEKTLAVFFDGIAAHLRQSF